jgi:hypothetical protein
MMTLEEVAEIINYCQSSQITYKARLQELGIPTLRNPDHGRPVNPFKIPLKRYSFTY